MSENTTPLGQFLGMFEPKHLPESGASRLGRMLGVLASDGANGAEVPSSALTFNEDYVFWGMRNIPATEATKHFMVCGVTGSGKSVAIQLFLQSIAPRFQPGRAVPEQLIVFDAKGDAVSMLAAMGLPPGDPNAAAKPDAPEVWILNPMDARSAVWDLRDVAQSPLLARHLATLLVPDEKVTGTPYFADAARELVYAVLLALNHTGSRWEFRDLLCALDSKEHIMAVTAGHPRAKRLAQNHLNDEQHTPGVLSTLSTKLGKFEQVAALWHANQGARTFSVKEFLARPGVLILSNDPVLRESLWPLNAILLRALTQEILRRPDHRPPRYWFVLDEFRAMGRVDCIHELVNRGRSKGASVLLGIQSVEGLAAEYGNGGASDILSQCAYKTFLRAGGHGTAQWAEQYFGQVRREESTTSENSKGEISRNYGVRERAMFIASFFLDLPFPGIGRPYVCVCDLPCLDEVLVVERSSDEVFGWRKNLANVPGVILWATPEDEELQPWDDEDEKKFCQQEADPQNQPQSKPYLGGKNRRRRPPKGTTSPPPCDGGGMDQLI